MAVNAQEFLANLKKAVNVQTDHVQTDNIQMASEQQNAFPLQDKLALQDGAIPKPAKTQSNVSNKDAINSLLQRARKQKKAAEAREDIVERLMRKERESQFAAVFQPLQKDDHFFGASHFVSTDELNKTVMRDGPIRVAAYIRVSTDSSDQDNSFDYQEQYFRSILSKNPNWQSAGVYSDHGISGTSKEKRTGYNRLLRHCSEGKIDRILCKSISRFARNTSDFMTALKLLKEHHVTIAFEKENLDTADPTSEFILTTLAAIAQEESRTISTNMNWGNQKRFPKGQVRNVDIYGYRFATGEDAMEMRDDGYQLRRVEIVEKEAAVVRRIFDLVEEGESYRAIARLLNREHIPAPNEGKKKPKMRGRSTVKDGIEVGWTASIISRIARSERYCGDTLIQKTYTPDFLTHRSVKNDGSVPQYHVKDHHPAIISREQYERVQGICNTNAIRYGGRKEKPVYPLSGRIICAHCGRAYNVRNTMNNPIWFCPTANLNNGKNVCHGEKVYEEQVLRVLRKGFTDRFHLLADQVLDDVTAADIISGRYEESGLCRFASEADSFVGQMRERLAYTQQSDYMERDRTFFRRQADAFAVTVRERQKVKERLVARLDLLKARKDVLGDEGVDEEDIKRAEEQIGTVEEQISDSKAEREKVMKKLSYLEDYWERLEGSHKDRDEAIEWMDKLPSGWEGTVAFLNGLTSTYVKAFALSITIHDPLHYTIRWFDDTYTDVEMYSNVEDYRYTAAYFDGEKMRERRR